MVKTNENALICDLAETYQIYDYKQLPVTLVAILACGLKNDSRIKLGMSKSKYTVEQSLLVGILDRLTLLVYAKTKDAQKGKNYPKLLGASLTEEREVIGFTSGKDFEEARNKILKGGGKWQLN